MYAKVSTALSRAFGGPSFCFFFLTAAAIALPFSADPLAGFGLRCFAVELICKIHEHPIQGVKKRSKGRSRRGPRARPLPQSSGFFIIRRHRT
jgi:hypothetical protein